MKATIIAISNLMKHIHDNVSSYLMLLGIVFISIYIDSICGFKTLLLFIGILLVITSLIIEMNNISNKKR